MGKNVHDDVLDAALNYVKSNATRINILTAEPTGASAYTLAVTNVDSGGYRLAGATITSADFTGPANGTTSGRKLTVNAQSSMSIDGIASSANSATHVALIDFGSSGAVLYTTTCTTQSLTAGNLVNLPAWEIELRDPS